MNKGFEVKKGLPKPVPVVDEFAGVKKGLPPLLDKAKNNKDLQSLIDQIPKEIPDNFRAEATRVAGWIAMLDEGGKDILNNPEVVDWLGDISKREAFRLKPNISEEELPWWLREDFMAQIQRGMFLASPIIDKDREQRLEEKFIRCGEKNGWTDELIDGVPYYIFNNGGYASDADGFKIYINSEHLEEVFDSGKFEEVINELQQTSNCPSSMKYLEDGVVIYFRQRRQSPINTRQIFLDKGINVSAPAQDVYQIIEKDGHLEMASLIQSNDSAFGITLPNNEYNPYTFFKQYLSECLKCGKRPDKPDLTSFLYVLTDKEELKQQASEMTDLPICFSERVLDELG